jgi:superfamily II DNA or RNA helicase
MADVHLRYINSVHIKVVADPSIVMELADHFTWKAPNYKFHPKFKMRIWDGNITLVNRLSGLVYFGLAKRIKKFCDLRGYTVTFDDQLIYEDVSEHELKKFMKSLNIPSEFESRDYQFNSILKCIRTGRRTLLSPTSSGKSLMIYVITQWYKQHKALIIVPTIGLVLQMAEDFKAYGYQGTLHLSTEGLSKSNDIDADVCITTWQSLNNGKTKMPKQWYNQFGVVFGDEAHGCKSASLINILSSLEHCKYRFGTTGTLSGQPLDEATIEGLFGPQYKSISTKELMDQGYVSKLKIKCIVLHYPDDVCKEQKNNTYHEEVSFLVNNVQRNKFIKNLTLSLEGNKLLFFRMIDHGTILHDLLKQESDSVFYIDGSIDGADREQIRKAIEQENNAILIASLGTTSTGVSIKKLHHMIAGSPSKSKIKVLQSIGRMLRMHKEKDEAILYDIVDNLTHKSHQNYTLKHFVERCKIYDAEEFNYTIYNVKIKH